MSLLKCFKYCRRSGVLQIRKNLFLISREITSKNYITPLTPLYSNEDKFQKGTLEFGDRIKRLILGLVDIPLFKNYYMYVTIGITPIGWGEGGF